MTTSSNDGATGPDRYLTDFGQQRIREFAERQVDTRGQWRGKLRYHADVAAALLQSGAALGILFGIAVMLYRQSLDGVWGLAFNILLFLTMFSVQKWVLTDWWWYDGTW